MAAKSATVRSRIEQDILAGRLGSGDVIDEQSIARRFRVSRTPAREALLQLEAAGLLSIVPRRGAVINRLSAEHAIAMIEVLSALEAQAAELSARRMTAAEIAALRRLHRGAERCARARDVAGYVAVNRDFHDAIYAGARNGFLQSSIEAIRLKVSATSRSSLLRAGRLLASWREHDAVVKAIAAGDDAGAARAMASHIAMGGRAFADMIATLTRAGDAG